MSTLATTQTITVPWIRAQKGQRSLSFLTAYDFPTAKILDESEIDGILIGDSLGTVVNGEPNTLSVTMDEMIYHCRSVSRAVKRALVIGDMPFMSYQVSPSQAVENAGRLVKEGKVQAIKLEGGTEIVRHIEAIVKAGIPVCAHIGLTPQSINAMGTYRIHGKTETEARYLLQSAREVEKAGAFAIVLECVEKVLSKEITTALSIPTIGIGSGTDCDGQILVTHDLVGLTHGHQPKFVRPLANLKADFSKAVSEYVKRTTSEWRTEATSQKTGDEHAPRH